MIKKPLSLNISTFEKMIRGNYLYIDKTEYIYNLFKGISHYYFLSRPRRFGKSLLVSTLKELFSGNKKLFKGLWIDSSDYEWKEYPVIYLDFSRIAHRTSEQLEQELVKHLQRIADSYLLNITLSTYPESAIDQLVVALSERNPVVILIDEYDKPLLDHLNNTEELEKQREMFKSFYDVIKSLDQYLRAVFLTGVSRFSKTSLFSGMNNINDISLKPEAALLLGYTEEEITTNFRDYIADFAQELNKRPEELINNFRFWYNGYKFSKKDISVYNPFSLLYALNDKDFRNYWFSSGTPSFLVNLLKKQYETIESIHEITISESNLGNFSTTSIPLIPLLFQTGYLTIANYDKELDKFRLKFPNFEVEESFTKFLVITLTQTTPERVDTTSTQLRSALFNNNINQFCSILETLFAHIPYTILKESYYHALLQFLLSLLSLDAHSEIMTDKGRIDLTLITKTNVYIFELKLNSTAQVALQQIKDKKYYERYRLTNKQIMLIGLAFNRIHEQLELEYVYETVSN